MSANDYRERIYARYATNFQDAPARFDRTAASAWGMAYRHYFRDWLPERSDARIVDLACGGGKLIHFFKAAGFADGGGGGIKPEPGAVGSAGSGRKPTGESPH